MSCTCGNLVVELWAVGVNLYQYWYKIGPSSEPKFPSHNDECCRTEKQIIELGCADILSPVNMLG